MKCTFFMLFCLIGVTFANNSYAQKTTLNIALTDRTVDEVLTEIEQGTEFLFFYNNKQVDVKRRVSVRAINKNIFKVLDDVFKGTNTAYRILDKNIILYDKNKGADEIQKSVFQQVGILKGSVVDIAGEPIIGASILVKGTSNGIITDIDGNFTLSNVAPNVTLIVSYVGYKTQNLNVGDKTSIKIVLIENAEVLDEVVVVGYGVQKKQSLTGAITSIKSEDIETTKTENLISDIQGKMPGLLIRQKTGEPGTFDNMISIRGYGNPLVVIDGITCDGTDELAQLNSDDIESISILKDASAAIYGMNAANGVIIVTTKKGLAEKTKISYSALFGIKNATGMEKTVDAYTYRLMANEMQRNIGAPATYSDDLLEKYKIGAPGYTDNDWIDMFMNKFAFQQSHDISVRGGTEKVKYFVSFGYNEDNGLLKSGIQYYHRYNLRTNLTAEIMKGLTLNVSVAGRWDDTSQPREDFEWTFKTLMVNDRGIGTHTINNPNHLSYIGPEGKNPFALVDPNLDGYRQRRGLTYQTNAELTWKVPFVKGLTLGALGSFDGNNRNNSVLQRSYDLYDYYTDGPAGSYGTDSYSDAISLYQKIYARAQANYVRSFGNHNVNLTAVTELTSTRGDNLSGSRQYSDLFTHDILDQGSATTAANSGNRNFTRLAAYLARANYDYAGKYLLEIVARYDGSYRYASSKRWAFFPSFSAGWRLSEENFIKDNLPFITNLKLRGSYGKSGLDAGDAFQYVSGYMGSTSNGYVFDGSNLTIGMEAPGVVNDNLSWITSKIVNIGLDFDLWNGKLGGSIELFQRKNEGLLATRIQSLPNTFGANFPDENINSSMNRGIELSFSHRDKIGKSFNYSVTANFTYAREKTLHDERAEFTSSWDRWKNGNEDRYTGRLWLYKSDGQYSSLEQYETAPLLGGDQGNSKMLPGSFILEDLNGDGIIDDNDRTPNHWTTGSNPPIQYGLVLAASYKDFDINLLFQGASGYKIGYANDDIWGYGRYPTLHEKYLDRWHTASVTDDPYNPATKWIAGYYPALRSNFDNTTDNGNAWAYGIDFWNPTATYIRLKSMEIGYNLPKLLTKRLGIGSARFFVNGFNLLTFCNEALKNADPEREERDWGANLAYPLMRSYNFGLNINF
ncbi:TonB-dependent receptor [uncultured Bacteroides sp.]|uniref:TonB-dependent receptor n=1 Tax=uncultured Bacteroides sp. TaxID=162156 RepID=UPI002AA90F25|nr:TonB-dependent receptor [uncultured Bacteroides sp.]